MLFSAVHSLRGLIRSRPLLGSECEFLEREFGPSLELGRIRLAGGGQPFGRVAWQPAAALIQLADFCFEQRDPQCAVSPAVYPILAHEALHVWQRVHKQCALHVSVDGLWLGLVRGRAAYGYDRALADPQLVLEEFLAGNIERQGQMFEDYVRSNVQLVHARDPKFVAVADYVRATGSVPRGA